MFGEDASVKFATSGYGTTFHLPEYHPRDGAILPRIGTIYDASTQAASQEMRRMPSKGKHMHASLHVSGGVTLSLALLLLTPIAAKAEPKDDVAAAAAA